MNYKRLPKGYKQIEVVDFVRNRKQLIIVNVVAAVLVAAMIPIGVLLRPRGIRFSDYMDQFWIVMAAVAMQVVYIPVHELVHGVFMFALTGVMPKFGVKLPYAYCGSTVWLDVPSHTIVALAPLVVCGIAIQLITPHLPPIWFWPMWALQIANVSGSGGDIYTVVHMLRLPKGVQIQDTGVRMRVVKPI